MTLRIHVNISVLCICWTLKRAFGLWKIPLQQSLKL